jgi:hypothetical protein
VVTAGLIGGRVGNKGAVGISLKIANTTMLFVNAHLTGKSIPFSPYLMSHFLTQS